MPKRKPRKRRLEAEGEAAAIYAKLEAEARGQYEILAKKGEGLKQIVEACGGAKEAFQLMMLEHLDTLAESSAKAISNIKFDKVVVWENGGSNGRSNTADFLHKMAGTLPPDDASDARHRRHRNPRELGQSSPVRATSKSLRTMAELQHQSNRKPSQRRNRRNRDWPVACTTSQCPLLTRGLEKDKLVVD